MFHFHRLKPLLLHHLNNNNNNKNIIFPTPKCCHLLLRFNLFSTTSSDSDKISFTVSYLTKNCVFSPQEALNASKLVHFDNPQKPDSVIAFFKNHGFSNFQIHSIILRLPQLIVSNPTKILLPKFQFLASKGASASDIVSTVTRSPRFLRVSLEKQIIPSFEFVRSFCPSDKKALSCIIACPASIIDPRMKPNVEFLLHDVGVAPSGIYHLLSSWPTIMCFSNFRKVVEEVKELGFDPSNYNFTVAVQAKMTVSKSQWDAKVDAFKSWGYSEDAILNAFKKAPNFMMRSPEKLNAVMSFWIGKLGWDPLVLIVAPKLFGYSLEKRLIPRASVVKYLLSKGLIKAGATLYTPFCLTDELFLKRFVKRFEKETSELLRLYQGEC